MHAKSGRKITTFVDQDDIRWGEIWRDRLSEEILRAAVFIPLLSASYLESDMCRMEYNKFQSAAKSLGVSELLLPVLVINAPAVFNGGSTDDIVRSVIERQYEVIEDAVLSDRNSSEWKRTMSRLADRFTAAYQAAEAKLAVLDPSALDSVENVEDQDLEAPGLAELMEQFQDHIATMTEAVNDIGPQIEDLGNAASDAGDLKDGPTPKEAQLWAFRVANAFERPALALSESGERLFAATREMDETVSHLRHIANELAGLGLADTYRDTMAGFSDLGAVRDQLVSLLDSMRPAEYMSVPIRKALRPARRGLTRVTDSIAIIGTWPSLDGPKKS